MSTPLWRSPRSRTRAWIMALVLGASSSAWITAAETPREATPYKQGKKTRDGLGVYYFGREIAHYMTHLAAPWLERPERDTEERPDLVLKALALKPGDVVADLGCGTGYFSWRMAQAVGPRGVVYGVDIQPEMIELLAEKMKERGVANVTGVVSTVDDPKLPQPVDLAIMVDVYHECSQPAEFIAAVCRSLKPGGRVVFIEYRGEDSTVPIKALHKMTEAQVKLEMTGQPLDYVKTVHSLPRQHLIIFKKRAAP